jgi:hypothetical protein
MATRSLTRRLAATIGTVAEQQQEPGREPEEPTSGASGNARTKARSGGQGEVQPPASPRWTHLRTGVAASARCSRRRRPGRGDRETKAGARGRRKRKGSGARGRRSWPVLGQGTVAGGGRGQGADGRDSGGGRGVVVQRREAARGGEQPPRHGNRRRAVRKPEWWTEQGQWHL